MAHQTQSPATSTISSTSAPPTSYSARPGSRTRALAWLFGVLVVLVGLRQLAADTEFDPVGFVEGVPYMGKLAAGVINPDWSVLPRLAEYTRQTIEMSILGTVLGAVLALPLSFLGARNLMGRNPVTRALYYVIRFLMSVIRAVPTLFWGLLFVAAVGIGQFAGVLALTVFSTGLLAKLYSEAMEAIDWGQIEAVVATGASPWQVLLFAILPQFFPYFVAHTLYSWEVNVHSATILGLIGAGGLGFVVGEYINQFAFNKTGTALLLTLAMTLCIDYGSAYLRSRII
ncbi:MAG: phosphonate ABC transporter, permease protein PhnE [Thermomicrobiales bacterium]